METVDYAKKLELENIGKNELIHRIQLLNTGSLVVITEQKVDYSATIDKVTDAGRVNKKNLEKVKKSSTKLGYKYTTHLIKGDVDKALRLANSDGGMMAYRSVKIKERANQLELFSFYTQNGTYANGISHWSISPDGVIERYEQVDFPSKTELELNDNDEDGQVKAKAKSKRAERKSKALKKAYTNLIYNMYKVIDVLELPDGNFEIIGEKYELRVVTTTTRNSQGVTSTQTTYYHDYGPAALIKVDSASNLGAVRIVEYTETFVNFNPGLAGRFIVQPEGSILAITPSYYGIINSKSNVNDVTPTTEIRKTLRNQKRRVNTVCETPKGSFLIGQRWGKMYPVIIELK